MKTRLKIEISSVEAEKIAIDLEKFIRKTSGLSPETYYLFNLINGYRQGYRDQVDEDYIKKEADK